jgi:hypothetical protein
MTNVLKTKLKIASWDEVTTREFEDGSKLTRADVTLADGTDGLTSGSFGSAMYYRPDGTSSYGMVMHLSGTLERRTGSFALVGEGTYDGTTASSRARILDGSATGDLIGITGTCGSDSTHTDYPFMPLTLTYDLG